MKVLCLGLSHATAPVALRERLCFTPAAMGAAHARFGCGCDARPDGYEELVILSTCNRLELYAAAEAPGFEPLVALMSDMTGVPSPEFEPYLYRYQQEEAVVHLCRVADVRKPRGFAPGEVLLKRWDAVKVYPKGIEEPGGE